jgi:hypothetical protein
MFALQICVEAKGQTAQKLPSVQAVQSKEESMKVTNRLYTDPNTQVSRDGKHWEPARPLLYSPNLIEKIKHTLGSHWSYGQPFCVICGKESADLPKK